MCSDNCSRSCGFASELNRSDDPIYILRLIGKVITVSLASVEVMASLPELGIGESVPEGLVCRKGIRNFAYAKVEGFIRCN